jgi:hypothetical protein
MGKLGGIFGWELSGNVYVCGDGGGWAFGFGQEVSFVWVLAGILDRGGGGILCGLMVLWVLGDGAATRRGWWLV